MIIPILILALPLPCAPLAAGSEGPIEDGSILQRYDLRSVLPSFDSNSGWRQTMHEGFDALWNERTPFAYREDFYEDAAPETISELITLILGDELHHEGRVVSLDGNSSLLVLAPPAVHKKIGLVLGAFEKALTAYTSIQVDILDLEEGDLEELVRDNVIPREDADRFVEALRSRGARHRRHSLNLTPGRTAIMRQHTAHLLVVDYDVEIAERAMAFDPRRLTVHEGVQLLARGVSSTNGTHLSLLFSDADLVSGPTEVEVLLVGNLDHDLDGVPTNVEGPHVIQSGVVRTRSIACTTFLANDSALVFGSSIQRDGKPSNQVVVLRRSGGGGTPFRRVEIPGSTRSVLMVNTELLGIPDFDLETGVYDPHADDFIPKVHALLKAKSTSFLSDWLQYRFSVWRQVGPWAIIITDPAWDDAAAVDLEKLIGSIRPAVDVVSASVVLGNDLGASAPFRWSMPVLPGFECGVVLGYSSTAAVDLDVEVAQGASVYDPEVIPTYHGLMASFVVSFQGQSLLLDARGTGMWPGPLTPGFKPGGSLATAIQQPVLSATGFDERRKGTRGEELRFGADGADGGGVASLFISFEFGD